MTIEVLESISKSELNGGVRDYAVELGLDVNGASPYSIQLAIDAVRDEKISPEHASAIVRMADRMIGRRAARSAALLKKDQSE